MKKAILLALMLILAASLCWAGDKFLIELTGSYMAPNDAAFKEVYGQGGFVPELRLHMYLGPMLYIWGGAGIFAKKGLTPELKNDAKSSQLYFSLGGGLSVKLGDKLNLRIGPGLFLVSYREKSAGYEQSGSRIGIRADADFLYALGARFVAGLTAGFATASDTVDGVSFKMGGFKAGAVLGLVF